MSRSRSVSRSRVTKLSDSVEGGEVLDPVALLDDLITNVTSVDIPLVVRVCDSRQGVNYLLKNFISKEYEVKDGRVKFGIRWLTLRELRVEIKYDLMVSDD